MAIFDEELCPGRALTPKDPRVNARKGGVRDQHPRFLATTESQVSAIIESDDAARERTREQSENPSVLFGRRSRRERRAVVILDERGLLGTIGQTPSHDVIDPFTSHHAPERVDPVPTSLRTERRSRAEP